MKIPFIQSSSLIELTMEGQGCAESTRRENSLSQYCKDRAHGAAGSAPPASPAPNCEDSEGLSFQWLLLVPQPGAKLRTETWKETRAEVSLTFLACHQFTQPLITSFLLAHQFHQSKSVWWPCLREKEPFIGAGLLLSKTGFPV